MYDRKKEKVVLIVMLVVTLCIVGILEGLIHFNSNLVAVRFISFAFTIKWFSDLIRFLRRKTIL